MKTIEQMHNEKQEGIAKAISSREKSIAYFNSINAAIKISKFPTEEFDKKEYRKFIIEWRNWFYRKWGSWYLKNMSKENKNNKKEIPL